MHDAFFIIHKTHQNKRVKESGGHLNRGRWFGNFGLGLYSIFFDLSMHILDLVSLLQNKIDTILYFVHLRSRILLSFKKKFKNI